jgi:hypothetical protein
MAGGQKAIIHHLAHFGGQGQETECIGHVTAAPTDNLSQRFLGMREFVDKSLITFSFFDRREVCPLNVFDQQE